MRALALVALAGALVTGCAGVQRRAVPTLHREALPADAAGLVALADRELQKHDPVAMANVLVAIDALVALAPKSFDVWRGARAAAFLSDEYTDNDLRAEYANRGVAFGKLACDADPARVEGHYWYGITLGQLADAKKKSSLVHDVLKEGLRAAEIDEKYDFAGPLRLVGTVYAKAPEGLSVGNPDEGVRRLDRAVALYPNYPQNVLHLGYALLEADKLNEAEQRFSAVLKTMPAPEWAAQLRRWKHDAEMGIRQVAHRRDQKRNGTSPF